MGTQFTSRFKGSKKIERHGKVFPATTEADFYSALHNVGIDFEWQVEYVFQNHVPQKKKSVLLRAAGVRKAVITVDFRFTIAGITYVIDTKGSKKYATADAKARLHRLKAMLYAQGLEDTHALICPEYDDCKTLLKLSLSQDKSAFWDRFHKIKFF